MTKELKSRKHAIDRSYNNKILQLKERSINLSSPERRRKYLQTLITSAHNDLIVNDKPMDKSRLLTFITGAVKLIHDMELDSNIEDIDKRLQELEDEYRKASAKGTNR